MRKDVVIGRVVASCSKEAEAVMNHKTLEVSDLHMSEWESA